MYTDSDSAFVGAFHDNNFDNDRVRLSLFAGQADLNLKFYGIGSSNQNSSINYNIQSDATFIEGQVRIPHTDNWFGGLRHLWLDSEVNFDASQNFPPTSALNIKAVTSSLGMVVSYDSRDDNYAPKQGQYFKLTWMKDAEQWGSDYEFTKTEADYTYYWPLADRHTLAMRAITNDVNGDAPFYLLSTLRMRGFPTGRYLDNTSASLQSEWRYRFLPRWGSVVFLEGGAVAPTFNELNDSDTITSYGFGVRWQAVRSKSLNVGIDVAYSDDDSSVYIRVGESF
jgi:outer membrane protein assembly factor BamA